MQRTKKKEQKEGVMVYLKQQDDLKLVGVHLPPEEFNILALYIVAKGITKTRLFKTLINDWMEKEQLNQDDLLEEIVNRVQSEWRKEKKRHPRANFDKFITAIKQELTKKGLSKAQVRTVLSNFEG